MANAEVGTGVGASVADVGDVGSVAEVATVADVVVAVVNTGISSEKASTSVIVSPGIHSLI